VRSEGPPSHFAFLSLIISSVVAWNDDIFKRLVLEARRAYEKEVEDRVHIFMADK
jgi:hypothetical protein